MRKSTAVQSTQPFHKYYFTAEDEVFSKKMKKIRDFVRFFDGKHRIVRGEKGIKAPALLMTPLIN